MVVARAEAPAAQTRKMRPSTAPVVRNDLAVSATAELAITAPFAGVVVAVERGPDDAVGAGAPVVVIEAMTRCSRRRVASSAASRSRSATRSTRDRC